MEEWSRTVTRQFHDGEYTLTIHAGAEKLRIECQEHVGPEQNGLTLVVRRWQSEFPAQFVEEITSRTGSFKSYPVFARMLASALDGTHDSVFLELLSARDLEALRNRAQPPSRPPHAGDSTKRYLILSYQAEFDKVHYPLSLTQCATASTTELMAVVDQLRAENAALRDRPSTSTAHVPEVAEATQLARELSARNRELEAQIRALEKENVGSGRAPRDHAPPDGALEAEVRRLRAELKEAEKTVARVSTQARRDVEKAQKDVANAHKSESRLQVKVRKLELEVDGLKGKLRAAGGPGQSPASRGRPSSAASSRASSVASSRASSVGQASAAGRSAASDRSRASGRSAGSAARPERYTDRSRLSPSGLSNRSSGYGDRYQRVAERRVEYSQAQRARSPRERATVAAYANSRPRPPAGRARPDSRPESLSRPPSRGETQERRYGGSMRWDDSPSRIAAERPVASRHRGASPGGQPWASRRDDAVRASAETRASGDGAPRDGLVPSPSALDIDARLGALQDYLRKNRYPMRE